jgi:hypothetical protein
MTVIDHDRASFSFNPVLNLSIVEFTHDRFQVGACRLWLPEGVLTERGYANVYPRGMAWQRDGDKLVQEANIEHAFGPGNVNEVEQGVLECYGIRTRKEQPLPWRASYCFGDDRVDFSLSVHNPHNETLSKVSAHVCLKFMQASWWSDNVCFLLTTDGVRTIAQLGRTVGLPNTFQAWLLEGETYDQPFYQEFWGYSAARAAAPVWVSWCEKAGCSVVLRCEDAYFIHSNAGNPCTDLALKFGDLAAGASATCSGYIEFTKKSVTQIFEELEAEK